MPSNVIHLPRPMRSRPDVSAMGLYLRVGWNQHVDLLETLAAGKSNFHGLIIDAGSVQRHRDLMAHALEIGLDVTLDPKTHAMALPGSFSKRMSELPWGQDRPHNSDDFTGPAGRLVAESIAKFAADHRFTQILGPTHILNGANDRWLRRDIESMGHLRDALDGSNSQIELIYPLAISVRAFRDPLERSAIIQALQDSPMDALWLRIENFGADTTGDKTIAYIEAARAFQALGVPVIADHVGGLSGLSLLAFGAVGGVSHGITLFEGFSASRWRRPPKEGRRNGMMATRVYVPSLDLHLKNDEAKALLGSSTRARGRFGCKDTDCCPGGVSDMLNNPTRHFVHQRIGEVARIAASPEAIRPQEYLTKFVRAASDDVSAAAGYDAITGELKKKLMTKQKKLGLFRQALEHFGEVDALQSSVRLPQTRAERQNLK